MSKGTLSEGRVAVCPTCGVEFIAKRVNQKHCSPDCRRKNADRKRYERESEEKSLGEMISTINGIKRLCFVVEGRPIAKARPRATRRGVVYTPKTTLDAERNIREAFLDMTGENLKPLENPVEVSISFYFAQPKGTSKRQKELQSGTYRAKKPDIDNLIKTVLDALNGIAWKDDNQVVVVNAQKLNSYEKNYTEVRICEV